MDSELRDLERKVELVLWCGRRCVMWCAVGVTEKELVSWGSSSTGKDAGRSAQRGCRANAFPRLIVLIYTWCPWFILLGNLPASNGLGMAHGLVYYSALKANCLCLLGIKNMFLVECAWLSGQRDGESPTIGWSCSHGRGWGWVRQVWIHLLHHSSVTYLRLRVFLRQRNVLDYLVGFFFKSEFTEVFCLFDLFFP